MNQSNFQYTDLKEEHVDQATILLTNSFLQQNPIWFNSHVKKTQANEVFQERVKRGLALQRSKVVVDNKTGKLAMVMIFFDAYDYLHNDFKISVKYKWQMPFANNAKELQTQFFKQLNPKKGQHIFGDLSGTNKQYTKNGVSLYFWLHAMKQVKKQGFKSTVLRITNPIVAKMLRKIGGQFIKNASLQLQDGKSFLTSLMIVDLAKLNVGKTKILPAL